MWLPYNTNQELTHISMIFTYWLPCVYKTYTWIAVGVTLIALLPICLYIYQKYCTKQWWRFIEFTVVYPHPNIYRIFINLDYRSVLSYYKTIAIIILTILALHYIPFILLLKIGLILGLIIAITLLPIFFAYSDPYFLVGLICLFTGGYYYNFAIGLPVIPPHYFINWLSDWLPFINGGKPITINPYDFVIDTNKYLYVYCLVFCYISLLKLILNQIYWTIFKHEPVAEYADILESRKSYQRKIRIRNLRKQLISKRKKAIKTGTYIPKNKYATNTNIKTESTAVSTNVPNNPVFHREPDSAAETHITRSLKLLGFKQQSIKVMLAEYSEQTISQALDRLDQIEDLVNPKAQFLEILQQLENPNA